jgi:hypothetical protein
MKSYSVTSSFQEIMSHPIPTDMEAAKALSCSPAALDLFMWLSYRCFMAKGRFHMDLFEWDSAVVTLLRLDDDDGKVSFTFFMQDGAAGEIKVD